MNEKNFKVFGFKIDICKIFIFNPGGVGGGDGGMAGVV